MNALRTMVEAGPTCVCGRPRTLIMDPLGQMVDVCFGCKGLAGKLALEALRRERIAQVLPAMPPAVQRTLRHGAREQGRALPGDPRAEFKATRFAQAQREQEERNAKREADKVAVAREQSLAKVKQRELDERAALKTQKAVKKKALRESAAEYIARTRRVGVSRPVKAYVRSTTVRVYKPRECSDCHQLYQPSGPRGTQCGCVNAR